MPYEILLNGIYILGTFAAFAVAHSLFAGQNPKARLKNELSERVVEGFYRIFYNSFSIVTFIPVLATTFLLPDYTIWQIETPYSLLLRVAQIVGVIGLAGALFVTDVLRFIGIKQLVAYLSGEQLPLPQPELEETGMYRIVRHPLYFFTLIVIWFNPTLTVNALFFNIGVTLYIIIGSRIEERRLIKAYGEKYREYRQRVSWLIPWFPNSNKV